MLDFGFRLYRLASSRFSCSGLWGLRAEETWVFELKDVGSLGLRYRHDSTSPDLSGAHHFRVFGHTKTSV